MHREARPEGRFMVLARHRKIEPLPSSLHGLQIGLELTTFPVINLALALRVNPAPSNALAQLQRVQPGPTGLGRDRMPPTRSDSTRKQNKGCVIGRAKHLGGVTQNIITRNTGVIVTILVMIGVHNHCDAIVLVRGGFRGWYDGWWYPAWGHDPYYSYYDYNSPIHGYDALRPNEVIANVQAALQQLGYYS
jgi:hypothetical protein